MNLLPIFLLGLLGAVHCVGMCGGIVSAFSVANPKPASFSSSASSSASSLISIPIVSHRLNQLFGARLLAFNLGRISSYAVAGAIAGGVSGSVTGWLQLASLQMIGYTLANSMLILLGLSLMGAWQGLHQLEAAGQTVWRHIQPLTRHLLPVDTLTKATALGLLWGWVPCGMVYSVLMSAMLSGSAPSGALVMLAFGAGTLPTLLSMGLLGGQLRRWVQLPRLRQCAGMIVLLFGVLGLLRTINGLSLGWLDALCVTPIGAHS